MLNLTIILAIIAVLTMILLYARLETHRRSKSSQISELPERDNRTKNVIHGTILGAILGAAVWAIVVGLCNVALATMLMYMDGIARPINVHRFAFGGAILGAIIGAIAGMILGTVVSLAIGFISRRKEPPDPARRQGTLG